MEPEFTRINEQIRMLFREYALAYDAAQEKLREARDLAKTQGSREVFEFLSLLEARQNSDYLSLVSLETAKQMLRDSKGYGKELLAAVDLGYLEICKEFLRAVAKSKSTIVAQGLIDRGYSFPEEYLELACSCDEMLNILSKHIYNM